MQKLPSPDRATTISMTELARFALTAAWPSIRPPIMPMAWPMLPGTLRPASRISWNTSSKNSSSRPIGANTIFREATTVLSASVDIIP